MSARLLSCTSHSCNNFDTSLFTFSIFINFELVYVTRASILNVNSLSLLDFWKFQCWLLSQNMITTLTVQRPSICLIMFLAICNDYCMYSMFNIIDIYKRLAWCVKLQESFWIFCYLLWKVHCCFRFNFCCFKNNRGCFKAPFFLLHDLLQKSKCSSITVNLNSCIIKKKQDQISEACTKPNKAWNNEAGGFWKLIWLILDCC